MENEIIEIAQQSYTKYSTFGGRVLIWAAFEHWFPNTIRLRIGAIGSDNVEADLHPGTFVLFKPVTGETFEVRLDRWSSEGAYVLVTQIK